MTKATNPKNEKLATKRTAPYKNSKGAKGANKVAESKIIDLTNDGDEDVSIESPAVENLESKNGRSLPDQPEKSRFWKKRDGTMVRLTGAAVLKKDPERKIGNANENTAIEERTTVNSLPNEILIEIFKLLDPIPATCLGLVSKKLYQVYHAEHGKVALEQYLFRNTHDGRSWHVPLKLYHYIGQWMPRDMVYCCTLQKFTTKAKALNPYGRAHISSARKYLEGRDREEEADAKEKELEREVSKYL